MAKERLCQIEDHSIVSIRSPNFQRSVRGIVGPFGLAERATPHPHCSTCSSLDECSRPEAFQGKREKTGAKRLGGGHETDLNPQFYWVLRTCQDALRYNPTDADFSRKEKRIIPVFCQKEP